ncbi:DEAD/DEAH box helicase family protein [Lutimonas saemankumensis]|uniref:DEAD/DEAH box helicase family protein n=1 Tax=Lutimonas saemankumensis TaxID=483016 RepID=UPI001CD45854|nr:DEAD/DEAH box helicase family protein [Lutimonas saemankumensis]MCA0933248.1 DEAD/DEAH box helicase family protein [Lutimonas saemankumensis]
MKENINLNNSKKDSYINEQIVTNERVINAQNKRYLSEFMDDLPENVMLNKVTTGCGMTTVALSNNRKYVIAVPFVALIQNKLEHCKYNNINALGVYGNSNSYDEIIEFKGDKIITTYDSLGKVTKALEERKDIMHWKILIDEAHKLVDSASFRTEAVQTVLDSYNKYGSYVFGTATPIDDRYQLPQLRNIPKEKINWGNLTPVNVNFCRYDQNIYDVATVIVTKFLDGREKGNAHIFINSVKGIISIINKLKSSGNSNPNQIRIVCADNNYNNDSVSKGLNGEYKVESINSHVKKINFYTATAFEGCDIYDEDGKTIILTDGSKDHTKIDIITVLPQIIGRIRNTKYKNTVRLYYNKSPFFSDITENEYERSVKSKIQEAEDIVKKYHEGSDMEKEMIFEYASKSSYLRVNADNICVNELALYNEMHNFSTLNKTFYVSNNGKSKIIRDGIKTINTIDYVYIEDDKVEIKGINKKIVGKRVAFKDECEDYFRLMENPPSFPKVYKDKFDKVIQNGFEILGEDKMRALKLRKKDISNELIKVDKLKSSTDKIVELLNLTNGKFYSNQSLKKEIQKVYDVLEIISTAKAVDVEKWYDVKKSKHQNSLGYTIINCKFQKPLQIMK